MKLFTYLYDRTLALAGHRRAPAALAGVSFAEASFFPVPPDVLMIPMIFRRPQRAWYYALLATLASAVGGVFGYAIGYFLFELIEPWLLSLGYGETLAQVRSFFRDYGVWIVFAAGFSPIPYKLFTLTAGAMAMPLLPFVLASVVGRGARFFLVAAISRWSGEYHQETIRRWIEWLGWLTLILIALFIGYRLS
ncbi:membrane protein YqaA, SNARE-associated domain [Sulfurivirga caldicuralii]|uniref:Membrane protein YqaA, SNARE-associated domain n=1 Tax=Sulfurivirga caldicuralii TaxID=364032 RepID=A0A1N6F9C9_9GAMM|nr:YqaA family protein [Sulfurivirga caldicuralii]SIN91804.1 membrane protein YqaA, SNARE-associated domain [Sulfurivirga caldicuralii]